MLLNSEKHKLATCGTMSQFFEIVLKVSFSDFCPNFFCHYKNNNKNRREMGLLSLSNLEICIKKAEFSDFKGKFDNRYYHIICIPSASQNYF